MLELCDIRIAYGRTEVVHGVDVSVAEGEVVGLIGPNGAGKTSILRGLCGLRRPSGGSVRLQGKSIAGRAPEEIADLGVALVPEGRHVFKTLSVEENLRLAAGSRGIGDLEATFERFPALAARAGQQADRLSGGEQQQLAIARALVRRPTLLVLDEPSLGLAPKMIDAIYGLLAELREERVTMLVVEQNAARTIDFCDRCVVLSEGRVCVEGTGRELRRDPKILQAYLGRQL
jgi:branched-chain amino acid transport system ATP-binding protein